MRITRKILFTLLYAVGIPKLFRYANKDALTILFYHGVAPERTEGIYNYSRKHITPKAFRTHLEYIAKHYNVLSLDEAIKRLRAGTLPRHALAITFDDGYRNFYAHALPVLKEFKMPATVFLVTDFVLKMKPLWVDRLEYLIGHGTGSRQERIAEDRRLRAELKSLPTDECERRLAARESAEEVALLNFSGEGEVYAPLTVTEIREIQEDGITIGAHTKSHPSLPHLPYEEAAEEILGSKQALEMSFGEISQLFCYPSGRWTEETEQLVIRAGFGGALTTIEGANFADTHPYRLRRFGMDGVEDRERCAAVICGMRSFLRNIQRIMLGQMRMTT
jgi:peptidoglycan/xylan/chitin deacetylase (PgdA/CDA1 family)